jgi:hypothetical protein
MLRVPQLKKVQSEDPYLYEALKRIVGAVNSLGQKVGVDPAPAPGMTGTAGSAGAAATRTVEQPILPGFEAAAGNWSNANFCLFGNPNTGRSHSVLTDGAPSMAVSGFSSDATSRSALRIEVHSSCSRNNGGDPVALDYSVDGGATFVLVYTLSATFAKRFDKIQLSAAQDPAKVQVRLRMTVSDVHTITLYGPRLVETVPA